MLYVLVYSMLLCELFKPNDCVKESKICVLILQVRKLRLKESYHVVKLTQIQIFYLVSYGSFHYTTLQSSVKFYFSRIVLHLRVSISETEVNQEHTTIPRYKNPGQFPEIVSYWCSLLFYQELENVFHPRVLIIL